MSRHSLVLALVLGLAVSLRLLAIVALGHPEILDREFHFEHDEITYHRPASALASTGSYSSDVGGTPTANRPPGIILPLALLYWLISPSPLLALGYVAACSIGVVLIVRALAWTTTHERRIADVATVIAAVLPTLLWTSSGIWSDAPALMLTLGTLWLLVGFHDGARRWLLIGVTSSIAYLTRPSALFLFPFLLAAALIEGRRASRLRNAVILTVAVMLPVCAWGVRNRVSLGEFFTGATAAGHTLWESNNPVTAGIALPAKRFESGVDLYLEAEAGRYLGSWVPAHYIEGSTAVDQRTLSELEAYHGYMELTVGFLRAHPRDFVRLIGYKLLRVFTAQPVAPSISGDSGATRMLKEAATLGERWFVLGFGALGMLWLYRTRSRARHYYMAFAVAGLLSVLVTYVNSRLFLPVTGALLVPAAIGAVRSWDRLRLGLQGRRTAGELS